ncbi:MAG: sulfatase [Acidobacteria bacterium]|nr:sulfatase [Candidatus Sulfomarinibacter kjeldsenii]
MRSRSDRARLAGLRRRWRPTFASLCLISLVACSQGEPEGPSDAIDNTDRPSFLLITLDTTRADHLEPYGAENVETPALSELAENGIVFEAEWLSMAGYRTAAYVSAAVLERRYGLDQGFDVYDDRIRSSTTNFERRMTLERRAGATTDRALAWLDTLGGDEPYFLWVHFYDPHVPYSPPSPWAEEYRDQPYDGEIAYMDSQIGRLLQHPRVGGDDVMVMAVGDHGESLGEHDESTHGLLVYDSTLRVPWILRLPGGPSGVRINAPISQVDLVPTVMDLLALDPKPDCEGLEGRSLVPILRGEDWTPERLLFAETEAPFFSYGWSRLRTVRQGAMKFIDAPVVELYDLGRDPDELQNLAADRTTDVRRLALEIEKWAAQADDVDSTVTVDSETAEQLRALGYIAGDPGRPEGQGRGNPRT